MSETKVLDTITDFITGREIPDTGAEANRQAVERFLVDEKGFSREDIEVDAPIEVNISGEIYKSRVDLVVNVKGKRFMGIKCAPGSLGSREREIISAARLLDSFQIPFSAVSDGKTAILLDTITGKKIGEGLEAIPSKEESEEKIGSINLCQLPEKKCEKEKIIFRSYDSMNVNRNMT